MRRVNDDEGQRQKEWAQLIRDRGQFLSYSIALTAFVLNLALSLTTQAVTQLLEKIGSAALTTLIVVTHSSEVARAASRNAGQPLEGCLERRLAVHARPGRQLRARRVRLVVGRPGEHHRR